MVERVLIIESDKNFARDIQDILELEGYEVDIAYDVTSGIDKANNVQFDVIICNLLIEGTGGYDVLDAIRKNQKTMAIAFIFISAKADKSDIRKAMSLGADDYLFRPFTAEELIVAVRSRLKRHQTLQSQSPDNLDELRSNIVTALPHEIRSPLTAVIGIADVLNNDDNLDETQRKELELLLTQANDTLGDLLEKFSVSERLASRSLDTAIALAEKRIARAYSVSFSAYYPKEMTTNNWHPLYVYIFRDETTSTVLSDVKELLGESYKDFSQTAAKSKQSIQLGAQITVTPVIHGFQFNPVSATIGFYDEWHRISFQARSVEEPTNKLAIGSMVFSIAGVIISEIPISIFVSKKTKTDEIIDGRAKIYDKVFCSYSRKDGKIVERVETAYKAIGMEYLRDLHTIRSGEDWYESLLNMIREADVFQLFWSEASASSQYVEKEWRHALQLSEKKVNFIRPVYWKKPIIAVPDELRHIHFAFSPSLASDI